MGGEFRRINGHNFITPTVAHSAFTNTAFAFTQGFGVLQFKGVDLLAQQEKDARIFLYGQSLGARIGILNRVSIDVAGGGSAAVGGDLDTILLFGALATMNVGGLVKARLFTLEDIGLQMSLGVGANYVRNLQVSPVAIALNAIEDLESVEEQIVQQADAAAVNPVLMVAEGIGPFGAQLSIGPAIGVSGEDPSTALDTALHLNFDFFGLGGYVPVAITGEYGLSYDIGSEHAGHTFVGGLHYSGRRDLDLGAIISVSPDEGSSLILGSMVIQYFF